MKKLFKPVLFAAALFGATQVNAQSTLKKATKSVGHATSTAAKDVGHATSTAAKDFGSATSETAKDAGRATSRTAKKVGNETADVAERGANKTASIASKGKAAVVDKKFDGKMGPDGQTVYINSDAKYYYVDKTGHRVFVTEAELKTKP